MKTNVQSTGASTYLVEPLNIVLTDDRYKNVLPTSNNV